MDTSPAQHASPGEADIFEAHFSRRERKTGGGDGSEYDRLHNWKLLQDMA
jgi:hypothetical protein